MGDEGNSAGILVSAIALLFCIVLAVGAWNYSEELYSGFGVSVPFYPYRPYVSIFVISAVVSLGALLYSVTASSTRNKASMVPIHREYVQEGVGISQIRCGSCGVMNDLDAVYCKKCGNQFKSEAKTERMKSAEDSEWDRTIKKCSNCGANYSRQNEKCPFCGKE